MNRRLPPFAKALQARGPGVVFVVANCSDGWRMAKIHPRGDVLLLPLGHDPTVYHWPVADCEVVLYRDRLDKLTVQRAADALLRDGATLVRVAEARA